METYFAKFLPVFGEVRVGDIIWDNHQDVFIQHDDIDAIPNPLQKFELFLCSKIINPGDKVYYTDPEEGFSSQFNTAITVDTDMIFISQPDASEIQAYPENVVRVLGKLSPNSLWVKEGNVFTSTDIKRYVIATDGLPVTPTSWGDELKSKYPDRYYDAYHILCSQCKTFH